MRKLFLISLICFFGLGPVPTLNAEEASKLPSSADQQTVETYVMAMVKRKLANDYTSVLLAQGFRSDQIQEVLRSPEYKNFEERVAANPELQKSISTYVSRALDPDLLVRIIERKREDEAIRRQVQMATFLRRVMLNRQLHQRKSYRPEEKSFWEELKTSISAYLFGEQS